MRKIITKGYQYWAKVPPITTILLYSVGQLLNIPLLLESFHTLCLLLVWGTWLLHLGSTPSLFSSGIPRRPTLRRWSQRRPVLPPSQSNTRDSKSRKHQPFWNQSHKINTILSVSRSFPNVTADFFWLKYLIFEYYKCKKWKDIQRSTYYRISFKV